MLANERLICKMSLEQKIRLVTSLNLYENSADDGYDFPVFRLARNPLENAGDVYATQFPSDKALCSSWNAPLVSEVYKKKGEEVAAVKKYAYFNVTDDIKAEGISGDYYLTAKTLAEKVTGLKNAGQFVNFEEFPESGKPQFKTNLKDVVFSEKLPSSVYVKSPDDLKNYKIPADGECLFFGAAGSVDEALTYFLKGCTLVFLKDNFLRGLVERLEKLTKAYRAAYADYRADGITLSELDGELHSLEVFNEEIIDGACDRLISALLKMRSLGRAATTDYSALNTGRVALFDEATDDALSVTAARQSAVLVKNAGVLPLADTAKVAVIGGAAKEESYQTEFYGGKATVERVPFYAINSYEIETVGYASGYKRGEKGRRDLIETAINVCRGADVAVVYLSAERGEKALPQGQIELVDELSANGVKIIAVVASDGAVDCAFAEKCAAALLTYRLGQGGAFAVLDILKGIASPSGRLTEAYYYSPLNNSEYYRAQKSDVRYPFGYGLTYTSFKYSDLKINERGISCTVENTGACDGFAVPQFYVQKADSEIFADKILRGYQKVFVKKGDGVRVDIPFDENTFKVFDESKGLYRTEGGEYTVTVGDNYFDDGLCGSVTLSEYIYRDEFKAEIVESIKNGDGVAVKFDKDVDPPEAVKAKKEISFGVKLFVAILFTVYCAGVLAAFSFTNIIPEKTVIIYAVLGAAAGLCFALFAVYVAIIAKKRKKQKYLPANDVLTDLIDRVDEFDEIAKVTYKEPVKEVPEPEDDDVINDAGTEKAFEPVVQKSAARTAPTVTPTELCENFRRYAAGKGIAVDAPSLRAFIAAVCSGKAIIITSKTPDILSDFLKVTDGYFDGCGVTAARPEWERVTDLIRKRREEQYVMSDFANGIYTAAKSPDKLFTVSIDGVNCNNLTRWFAPFISYANHPSEEHTLKINDELSLRLPDNVIYILAADETTAYTLQREVADACLKIELNLTRCEGGASVEIKPVSPSTLEYIEKEAREKYFLPEKIWKKFDGLFAAVDKNGGGVEKFTLGNKNVLQLEKFTSVLLECGADESECVKDMLLSKIAPLLKLTRAYAADGGDKTVLGIIEKIFGDEDTAKIQRALSKAV